MRQYLIQKFRELLNKASEQYDNHAIDNSVFVNVERQWFWNEDEFEDLIGEFSGGAIAYLEAIYGEMYDFEIENDKSDADYTLYIQWHHKEPLDNPFSDCIESVFPDDLE